MPVLGVQLSPLFDEVVILTVIRVQCSLSPAFPCIGEECLGIWDDEYPFEMMISLA